MTSAPSPSGTLSLREQLRLIVITDKEMAVPRPVRDVVLDALKGGARAIQIRDKTASDAEILELGRSLLGPVREVGGVLFVNDRLEVALEMGADGVHLGPDDMSIAEARRVAPEGFLIGYSCDDPEEALAAERDGADYIGCGTVFATATKPDAGEAIGTDRLDAVAGAVSIPVVGIGGITLENVSEVLATQAVGVAVVGAVMGASDVVGVVGVLVKRR